ncbi:CBS domain-containing protein [Rhizobiales bacterium L72]|uniref:CBS domain-containing protein n=2 Tax=Propylenella binzhouense TaxID=2555902 RepID=A0A964T9C0_9HYPH|nr:chloride channel protein [Propylenella binzhouense]MYZ50174.1 CBS domain-containing protein [Propylenella binzhouense]
MLCVVAFSIGVVAAVGAVIFRYMISFVHNLFFNGTIGFFYDANQFEAASPYGPLVILAPVIGGLIVVFLVQTFAPEAKGHGVPEVMYAVYHKNGDVRGVVAVVKSIASAISIGSGASVGREGPIIQIGSSFGSTIARALRLPRWQKINLLAAGAGAGIAATFNTPLGGVLFAVELLLPEVSGRTFLPVVVATATATYLGRIALGLDPAFFVPLSAVDPQHAIDLAQLVGFALLGLLAGVASWAFVRVLAFCEDVFPKLPGNAYTQNIVGMLAIGLMSYAFLLATGHYHVAGVGYATIQSIVSGDSYGVGLLLVLLAGKVLATSISLGAGASGGVFSPSLFIGATLGGAVGALGAYLLPGHGFSAAEFAVVGMGALVGGATGASMTAIVMIFEMTRDYNVIVPLVLAVALAVGVRRWLVTENIYTIKLRGRGRPIPTIRHTNMYLVQQAQDLMSRNFLVLPAETKVADALTAIAGSPGTHLVVTEEGRIVGFVRFGSVPYAPSAVAEQTLADLISDDFVIAPETSILNTIIARMSRRQRSFAIVVRSAGAVPRPEDVVGVIDAPEIAGAVIRNHYA